MTIEAVTWNVNHSVSREGREFDVLDELRAAGAADAPLVALQEVGGSPDDLARRSPDAQVVSWDIAAPDDPPGPRTRNVVLSRFPVTGVVRTIFPQPDLRDVAVSPGWHTHRKGALLVRVSTPLGPVVFGSLHLYPFHHFGRDAGESRYSPIWSAVRALFDDLRGTTFAVAGDFNAENRSLATDDDVVSTFGDVATRPNGRSHDDIVHSTDLVARGRAVLDGPSDHYVCRAELAVVDRAGSPRRRVSPAFADS